MLERLIAVLFECKATTVVAEDAVTKEVRGFAVESIDLVWVRLIIMKVISIIIIIRRV